MVVAIGNWGASDCDQVGGLLTCQCLAIEVASPATAAYDRHEKYDIYARAGVREYWLVDPVTRTVEVLMLESDTYRSQGVFGQQATLVSEVVPGIAEIRVERFFAFAE